MGLIPNRGPWEYELFDTDSTATIRQGSLVQLSNATNRAVSEYSGGESSYLGILMHNSVNSVPTGKVLVALPTSGACTAMADCPTGLASSVFSLGDAVGIYKSGNTVSFVTDAYTSAGSNVAIIRGAIITSPASKVEVAFLTDGGTFYSSTSQALA